MEMDLENITLSEITQKDKNWVFFLTCGPRDLPKVESTDAGKSGEQGEKAAFDHSMLCARRETLVSSYTKLLRANDNLKAYIIIKSGFKPSLGRAREHRLDFSSMPFNLTMQGTHYREEFG